MMLEIALIAFPLSIQEDIIYSNWILVSRTHQSLLVELEFLVSDSILVNVDQAVLIEQ